MSDNPFNCNFDESKVPEYELPSALLTANGKEITSAFDLNSSDKFFKP
jgi:hypothetical protein